MKPTPAYEDAERIFKINAVSVMYIDVSNRDNWDAIVRFVETHRYKDIFFISVPVSSALAALIRRFLPHRKIRWVDNALNLFKAREPYNRVLTQALEDIHTLLKDNAVYLDYLEHPELE